jgi:hypothetical protein
LRWCAPDLVRRDHLAVHAVYARYLAPVRQALDQPSANDLCDSKSIADKDSYAICAVGFPARPEQWRRDDSQEGSGQDDTERMRQTLMDQTSLYGKDQSSIFPKSVAIVPLGDKRAVLFLFPRDGRIEDTKELALDCQLGRLRRQPVMAAARPEIGFHRRAAGDPLDNPGQYLFRFRLVAILPSPHLEGHGQFARRGWIGQTTEQVAERAGGLTGDAARAQQLDVRNVPLL